MVWLPPKEVVAPVLMSISGINSGLPGKLVREAILRGIVSGLQCPLTLNSEFNNAEESM